MKTFFVTIVLLLAIRGTLLKMILIILMLLFTLSVNLLAQDSLPEGEIGMTYCGADDNPRIIIRSDSIGKTIFPFLIIHEFNHADKIIESGMGCHKWREELAKKPKRVHRFELEARCANVAYAMEVENLPYDMALRSSIAQYHFSNWGDFVKYGSFESIFRKLCPEKRALLIIAQTRSSSPFEDALFKNALFENVVFECFSKLGTCLVSRIKVLISK